MMLTGLTRRNDPSESAWWSTSYGNDSETMDRLFARVRAELWQQAEARRAADSAEDMRRRKAGRRELLPELQREAYERVESGGVVQFQVRGSSQEALAEPGSATVCCGCQATFMLNVARPAALCKCEILYHATPYFDGELGREMLKVRDYPPESKARTSQPAR